MIALIQRVRHASVSVDGACIGEIQKGLLVFLAVENEDQQTNADKICNKILNYRVFPDSFGKMNLNVQQAAGSLLIVSQFTLAADTQNGMRPSFSNAATPSQAAHWYQYCVNHCKQLGSTVETGKFAANMQVSLLNDGPVTFWLQS